MSFDDTFFPGPPGRPQHPDFLRLADVVLQLDGKTEDDDFDFVEFITETIDPESMAYMAEQRALRHILNMGLPPQFTQMLAAMWIDGFCTGNGWAGRG